MMFIPWFEVDNASDGGTTYVAALAVTVVHNDLRGNREIVVQGRERPIVTRLTVDEIFDRMGDAIEGARNAEMDVLYPKQASEDPKGTWSREGAEVSQRNTEGTLADTGNGYAEHPVEPLSDSHAATWEPLPGWVDGGGI